jgi:hypothetical protein
MALVSSEWSRGARRGLEEKTSCTVSLLLRSKIAMITNASPSAASGVSTS